jgi:hypothetical protein
MTTFRSTRLLAVLGVLVLALSGCGDGLGTLYPVSGKVTLDGEVLQNAQLSFVPDTDKGNKSPASATGKVANGTYSLITKDKAGAPAGWYKVVINTQYPGSPENAVVLPKNFSDANKSGLFVEVVENPGPGAYDLNLKVK